MPADEKDLERLLATFREIDRSGSGLLPEGLIWSALCRIGVPEADVSLVIKQSACSVQGGMASYPALLRWLCSCDGAEGADVDVRVKELAAPEEAVVDDATLDAWDDKYNNVDTLVDALSSGDTALVKGSWLLELAASGRALPRRQELPPEALFDAAELEASLRKNKGMGWNLWEIMPMALSYCWATKEHPDPTGEQMRRVARAVRAYLSKASNTSIRDVALFIDWASLFQEPRNAEETASFKRGLRDVNLWYAHRYTISVLLTPVPEGVRPYKERGWPTFEFNISCLAKNPNRVLDLGVALPGPEETFEDFDDIMSKLVSPCKAKRPPPCSPETFETVLASLHFTNGSDRDFVMKKYTSTFQEVMGSLPELWCPQFNWTAEDAKEWAKVLLWCKRAKALDVGESRIGPEGAKHLASALPKCPSLRTIDIGECYVKEEGLKHILAVLGRTNLRNLWLMGNDLEDSAVDLLVDFITGERKQLYELSLRMNLVTDAGAKRLADALCQGDCELQLLRLNQNERVTDASVDALCEALQRSPCLKTLDVRKTGVTKTGRQRLVDVAQPRGIDVLW